MQDAKLIARPPDEGRSAGNGSSGSGAQFTRSRPPQPDLRSVLSRARANQTAFLGDASDVDSADGSVAPEEAGADGLAVAAVANIMKSTQTLAAILGPAIVPPEASAWIDGLMRNVPGLLAQRDQSPLSLLSQQQSGASTMAAAARAPMPMRGPMPMPMGGEGMMMAA